MMIKNEQVYKLDRFGNVVTIYPNLYQCSMDEHINHIKLELLLMGLCLQERDHLYLYESDWLDEKKLNTKLKLLNKFLDIGKTKDNEED